MPRIIVEWFNTRSEEQRIELARRITQTFVDVVQCKPDDVTIRFDEYEPRMFARGGVMGHQKR